MQTALTPESPLGDPRSLAKNRVWDFFQDSPTFTRAELPANTDSTWGFDFLTENSRRGVLDQLITSTAPSGTTSYSYDASGNLIEKSAPEGVTTYGYDWQDRLSTVTTPEHTASYEYDHDGIRVAKTVDGVRINFTVDKNRPYAQVIEERDDGGALLASYVHGVDLISQHRDGHDYYYHTDEQGSVVALSDENGAKAAVYFYTSYGELWRQGQAFADTNKYRYTGEQFDDETGFYYLRARYYDPGVGRFVTRDRHPGNSRDPLTMNKYLYGNANPMLYVDPSGHVGVIGVMAAVAVVGIMSMVSLPAFGGGGGVGGITGNWWKTPGGRQKALDQIQKEKGSWWDWLRGKKNILQYAEWAINAWTRLELWHRKPEYSAAGMWTPPELYPVRGVKSGDPMKYFSAAFDDCWDLWRKDQEGIFYSTTTFSGRVGVTHDIADTAGWYQSVKYLYGGLPFSAIDEWVTTVDRQLKRKGGELKYDENGVPLYYR